MATLLHNITTTVTTQLLAAGDNISNIKSITLSNLDSSNAAKVDLFLYDGPNNKTFYILKNVLIPITSTLALNQEDNIVFNNSSNGFSLRTQIDNGSTTAVPVDIIIKK